MQQIEDDVRFVDLPHGAEADDFAVKLVACPRGNRAIPIVEMWKRWEDRGHSHRPAAPPPAADGAPTPRRIDH